MPEPVTTLGVGAIAAYLGKDGLQKLLGPTADYLGGELAEFTKKRAQNIGNIFQNANKKLGKQIDEEGSVPPKILKSIINDASFNDDRIAIEYFGGVLASSRTKDGRDDRGAKMTKLVDNLSTYQLRTHYLIYKTIKKLFKSKEDNNLNLSKGRNEMEIFIPFQHYVELMDFTEEEISNFESIIRHIFFGLSNDGLIENNFSYGNSEDIISKAKNSEFAKNGGIICQPSALGSELFLWAFGESNKSLEYIFDNNFNPHMEDMPSIISNAISTKET
ncbi:MAG: hypothetical protein KAI79_05865 [Bacteroidales bacterium]|nr:hypothetical protein [Bacteroidales bacterium]